MPPHSFAMGARCKGSDTNAKTNMGNISVGKLHKNKIVKDFNGNIIDWYDEANGGWIVRKREVVNQERWNQHIQKQKDKAEAAKAVTMQKVDENAPDRTVNPNKIQELEKRIEAQDSKLDAILAAIKK